MSLAGLRDAVRSEAVNNTFCHFDFHSLNVLAAGSRVTALLDFPHASLGDHRADLGRTQAIISAGPIPPGPMRFALQFARGRFVSAWKRGYEAEAGPTFPLDPLFEAWGAASFLGDQLSAIEESRGWGERDDLVKPRAYLEGRLTAAGLSLD
jgi:aminoglycoside phosphotransferase (APT) family kinase protein